MPSLFAMITEATCGEACWSAREEECRCSCGGKNHGINKTGERAERTAKIDGYRYKLVGVGKHRDLVKSASEYNLNFIVSKSWDFSCATLRVNYYEHLDKGAMARVKYATEGQIEKWHELAAYDKTQRYLTDTSLLWLREDFESAQSVYVSPKELEVGAIMKDLSCEARHWVWEKTMRDFPQADWKSPAWYLFLNKTIERYPKTIAARQGNSHSSNQFSDEDFNVAD